MRARRRNATPRSRGYPDRRRSPSGDAGGQARRRGRSGGPSQGTHPCQQRRGEPAGFVIRLDGGYTVYQSGDTNLFGDMRLIGELPRPNLALLPIGGHYTMGPREAALAVELLGVKDVMPIHYGTYPILAGTPDELRDELSKRGLGDVAVHAPLPGGKVE